MRILLHLFGPEPGSFLPEPVTLRQPYADSTFVVPADAARRCPNPTCPAPGGSDDVPWKVAGASEHAIDDRTIEAKGVCLGCRFGVGKLVVHVNTIFGLEEDRAVLRGRPRVY